MGPYIKFISGVIVLTYDSNYRGEITPIKPIDFKVPISLHHDRLGAHLVYPYPRMPPKKLRSPRTWGRGWKSFSPHFKKKKIPDVSVAACCMFFHRWFPPWEKKPFRTTEISHWGHRTPFFRSGICSIAILEGIFRWDPVKGDLELHQLSWGMVSFFSKKWKRA